MDLTDISSIAGYASRPQEPIKQEPTLEQKFQQRNIEVVKEPTKEDITTPPVRTPNVLKTAIATEVPDSTVVENQFNYDKALQAGMKPIEIIDFLKSQGSTFDFDKASKDGLSPDTIVNYLNEDRLEVKQQVNRIKDQNILPSIVNNDFMLSALKSLTGYGKALADTKIGEPILEAGYRAGAIAHDIYNKGGIDGNSITDILMGNNKKLSPFVEEIDNWSKMFGRNIQDRDFLSIGTLGSVIPDLMLMPISIQTRTGIIATGAISSYANARTTSDVGESLVAGAIGGALTAGVAKVFDSIAEPAHKGVYDYFSKELHIDPTMADDIFNNWAKVTGEADNFANRTKAILDYSGEIGAQLKSKIGSLSDEAAYAVTKDRVSRVKEVKSILDTPVTVTDIAKRMDDQRKLVKDNYSKFSWEINNLNPLSKPASIKKPITVPEIADEALSSTRRNIVELINHPEATVTDYINAMPDINEMYAKAKGRDIHSWKTLKKEMESIIKNNMSATNYQQWRKVNDDYANMAEAYSTKLGEALGRVLGREGKKSNVTPKVALDIINKDKGSGDLTFTSIQKLIGSKDTADLETMIIKGALGESSSGALGTHIDDISWQALAKSVNNNGFVTKEGKQLTELINTINTSFRTDDIMKAMISAKVVNTTSGMGTDLPTKGAVYTMGKVFNTIVRKLHKSARMEDALLDILKSDTKFAKFNKAISDLAPGVKQRMLGELEQELPTMIEYKPRAMQFTTSEPIYVTPRGTATTKNNISNAMITDDLEVVLKDMAIMKAGSTDRDAKEVIDFVYKMAKEGRISKIVNNIDKLKSANKAKAIANAINSESKIIRTRIQKDSGVKLSEEDSKKLSKHIFDNYLKGMTNE